MVKLSVLIAIVGRDKTRTSPLLFNMMLEILTTLGLRLQQQPQREHSTQLIWGAWCLIMLFCLISSSADSLTAVSSVSLETVIFYVRCPSLHSDGENASRPKDVADLQAQLACFFFFPQVTWTCIVCSALSIVWKRSCSTYLVIFSGVYMGKVSFILVTHHGQTQKFTLNF